jgi:hypothetical protein
MKDCFLSADTGSCPIWMTGPGRIEVSNTSIVSSASGSIRFSNALAAGSACFSGCVFQTITGSLANVATTSTGTGYVIRLNRCAYHSTNTISGITFTTEDMGDNAVSFGGGLSATNGGSLIGEFTGTVGFLGGAEPPYFTNGLDSHGSLELFPSPGSGGENVIGLGPISDSEYELGFGTFDFDTTANIYDWRMRRTDTSTVTISADGASAPANLAATGYFDPASLKIGGTEVVSSARAVTATSLSASDQPYCELHKSSAQSVGVAGVVVAWEVEDADTANLFTVGTSATNINLTSGVWTVSVACSMNDTFAVQILLDGVTLFNNGATGTDYVQFHSATFRATGSQVLTIRYVAAHDSKSITGTSANSLRVYKIF